MDSDISDYRNEPKELEALPIPEALSGKGYVYQAYDILFDDHEYDSERLFRVFKFVGIVVGLIFLLVIVSIICCCCLPCCFLAKRRTNRGAVHGPAYQGEFFQTI